MHINVEKNRQFVYYATSVVSNIIYAITDVHWYFSSDIISCCAACFAQIVMLLIQCYNSTVSLGYPPTCNEAVMYLSTLENTFQNRPSWKCNFLRLNTVFFKKNIRYPIWTCRGPISLILGTRFSLILGTRWWFFLILGTRFSILGTQTGFLKHLKKALA